MNKLIPLLAFSILLLVPVGAQNVFANHPQVLDCPVHTFSNYKGDLINEDNNPAIAPDLFGGASTAFCQDSTLPPVCAFPYMFGTVSSVFNQPYVACISQPILVDDPTHPDQCQGASILLNNHCFAQALSNIVGGELLDLDTMSLFIGAIGVNPVITGLVAITMGGVAAQAIWFVHRRRKSE